MMKSDEKYQVPAWMRPLLPLLCNTGGNDPEELLNDTETTASANVVRYVLIVAVRSQVDLLQLLYRKGLLRTEIPGGFSPEEAQALLDNLVRSHISKALSGERMAARDRNADLAWIRGLRANGTKTYVKEIIRCLYLNLELSVPLLKYPLAT